MRDCPEGAGSNSKLGLQADTLGPLQLGTESLSQVDGILD